MAEDIEQKPTLRPLRGDVSRRSVLVGLIGVAAAEAWQGFSQLPVLPVLPLPCIQVSPTLLNFTLRQGQTTSQRVAFTNCGASTGNISLTPSTSDGAGWLLISGHISGALGSQEVVSIDIAVNSTELILGTYTGTVTFTITTGGGTSIATTNVVLTVSPQFANHLVVNPSNLDFGSLKQGESASLLLAIGNTGTQSLNWTADKANASWIVLSTLSGTIQAHQQQMIQVKADASQLPAGSYSAILTITSNADNSSVLVAIKLTVSPPLAAYRGIWQNVDPNTRGWVRIEITSQGNTLVAHFFGACTPTPCDAGSTSAPFEGNPVHLHADESFATRDFTLFLAGDILHVTTFTHFTDNSGRSDYTSQDDFHQ